MLFLQWWNPPYLVFDKSNEALETPNQSVEFNRISEFVHTLLRVHSSKTELQFRLLFLVRVLSRRKAEDEMRWLWETVSFAIHDLLLTVTAILLNVTNHMLCHVYYHVIGTESVQQASVWLWPVHATIPCWSGRDATLQ